MKDKEKMLELTKEQKSAIKSMGRAFKKCKDANVFFHNCYGDLIAYNGEFVEVVDDDKDELGCRCGEQVEQHGYSIDSWADDRHYIHFKDE